MQKKRNKLLLVLILVSIFSFSFVSAAVPSGYVAYWKFEGNANDETGNNHGTLMNGALIGNDSERGLILQLDGTNDYVNVGSNFNIVGDWTGCAWINFDNRRDSSVATREDIMNRYRSFAIEFPGSKGYFQHTFYSSGWRLFPSSKSVFEKSKWYHVCVTRDKTANKVKTYIDGSLDISRSDHSGNSESNTIRKLYIGAGATSSSVQSGTYFDGKIDEVMIYNRALSETEVNDIFKDQSGQQSQTCDGTDINCGTYPNCQNCNNQDGCLGTGYRNYYCFGTTCTYTTVSCTNCSCTCGGYNVDESSGNGNCADGKDNDCDGNTDNADSGCEAVFPTDYTDQTCNVDGSASSTNVACTGKNEDATDATLDDCVDGTSNSYMHIEDIFVDATTVLTTDTVVLMCDVCCYSSGTQYTIAYNNGSGWRNVDYGSCIGGSGSATCTGVESKTINVSIDDVPGTHYFRCTEKWSTPFTGTETCDSFAYSDNDDISIEVIESEGELITILFDDFETDFAAPGWYDDGIAEKWTRDSLGTSSSSTGPTTGAEGTDYYIYVETSSTDCYTAGETAIVYQTPEINFNTYTGEYITWWSNMYGASIGTLKLEENTSGTWNELWSLSGDQGTDWLESSVDLSGLTGTGNLRFHYTCGGGFQGDAAIDEISIEATDSGSCEDECSVSGQKTCEGNGYKTCGNYDADSCLEWSNVISCSAEETCSNGECVGTGETDYTDQTCNVDGSASSTNVACSGKNEDSTDATFDDCVDGTSNSYMHIEDIFVDATTVLTTDTVQVKCDVCCFSSGTEYGITYNNGSGWQNKHYGNCISGSRTATCTGVESKTINVSIDDVPGTHYFRCWESWSGCDSSNSCCSSTYADNDDISIEVISGGDDCGNGICDIGEDCSDCPADCVCGGATPYCSSGNCVECLVSGHCDNGAWCDGAETCSSGNCISGTTPNCNDGVACTDDSCNEATDSCDNEPSDDYCETWEYCDPQSNCKERTCDSCSDCELFWGIGCGYNKCKNNCPSCYYDPVLGSEDCVNLNEFCLYRINACSDYHQSECGGDACNLSCKWDGASCVETTTVSEIYDIYISPTGSDLNKGDRENPLVTLNKARQIIRNLPRPLEQPVNVYLRRGEYLLNGTFTLGDIEKDSGDSNPITYQSYPGEQAEITSGINLNPSWSEYDENIYVSPVSLNFNSLFINGERAVKAKLPNEGFYEIADYDSDNNRAFYFNSEINPGWRNLQDVEIVASRNFIQSRFKIKKIEGKKVYLSGKSNPYYFGFGQDRYYIENVFEGLSEGEWYLDKNEKKLYYYPKNNENINELEFIAPVLTTLIEAGNISKLKESYDFDYLEIKELELSDKNLGFNGSFTISMFLKVDENPNGTEHILSKGYPLNGKGLSVHILNGIIKLTLGDGEVREDITSGVIYLRYYPGMELPFYAVREGEWLHVAWTFDRNSGKIRPYANGTLRSDQVIDSDLGDISNTDSLIIGTLVADAFKGYIDEIKIYNRVLTDEEITKLSLNQEVSEENLELSLSFDENLDDEGNGNIPLVHGNPVFVEGKYGKSMNFSKKEIINNTYDSYLNNVNFRNLKFTYTDYKIPENGYPGSQSDYYLENPAILLITKNSKFENNVIKNVGEYALASYSQNLEIKNNKIHDAGAGAIRAGHIGDTWNYKLVNRITHSNKITNNEIFNTGEIFAASPAISIYHSESNEISNNEIYNASYSGISLGWWTIISWETFMKNNLVKNNKIRNVMQKLNDGGGIYLLGKQPGTKITNNIIENVEKTSSHLSDIYLFGIYFDNAEDILATNNLVKNVSYSGIIFYDHLLNPRSTNKNNTVTNNIFLDSGKFQTFFHSYQDSFYKNIVYCKNKTTKLFFKIEENIIDYSDYNLFPGQGTSIHRFYNKNTGAHFYTANKQEKDSVIANYPNIWSYEGVVFYALTETKENTVPVYRFYDKETGMHFYTIQEQEKEDLINQPETWDYEGEAFFVLTEKTENTVPAYLFVNKQTGEKFYTINENEKNSLISNYPHIWKYKGEAFYVYKENSLSELNDWRDLGYDLNSITQDPLFENYENNNFNLKPESPAFELGFENIDFSQVGTL